jgi:4-amino-4-deoxy-L-arabinose transferase-like glycosyltransferase
METRPAPREKPAMRFRLAVCLIILLGFWLRVYHLGFQSIWWDEAWVAHLVKGGLPAILALPGGVAWRNPPLHEFFELAWTCLAGLSEVSLRFPSLLSGILVLPVTYRLARTSFNRATALVSTGIAALSPALVSYSQEARVYAVLPLLYLLLIYLLQQIVHASRPSPFSRWLKLAGVEALLLYAHFFSALGLVYGAAIVLIAWARQRRIALGLWIGSQLLALALFTPWLISLGRHWDYIRADITHGNDWLVWANSRPQVAGAIQTVFTFFFTAIPNPENVPPLLQFGVAALGVLSLLAVILVLLRGPRPGRAGELAAYGLIPLGLYFTLWFFSPALQPRYALIFFAPLVLTLGGLITQSFKMGAGGQLLGGLLALTIVSTSALALDHQYFDERFFKDDARGVAAYLETVAQAGDVILAGPNDYAVEYYYHGPASLHNAADTWLPAKALQLKNLAPAGRHLFVVDWNPSNADLHGVRPFLLSEAGALVAERYIRGFTVRTWFLTRAVENLPEPGPLKVRFGPLVLTGLAYPPQVSLNDGLPLALRWRATAQAATAYRVEVRLLDPDGRLISSTGNLLLDEAGLPTQRWTLNTDTLNFYALPLSPALRNGGYTLEVSVSDGFLPLPVQVLEAGEGLAASEAADVLRIAGVRLAGPPLPAAVYRTDETIGGWARLVGFDLPDTALSAGQPFYLRLYWEALNSTPLDQSYTVFTQLLAADGQLIAQHDGPPANELRLTTRWHRGDVIVDEHRLTFSEPGYSGPATLIVGLYDRKTGARLTTTSNEDHITLPVMLSVSPP